MGIPRNLSNLAPGASSTGVLDVTKGGTGSATLAANNVLLGNGTSALQAVAPGTSGNVLTSNGTTWTSASAPASSGVVTATASGAITSGKPVIINSNGTVTQVGVSFNNNATLQTATTPSFSGSNNALGLVYHSGIDRFIAFTNVSGGNLNASIGNLVGDSVTYTFVSTISSSGDTRQINAVYIPGIARVALTYWDSGILYLRLYSATTTTLTEVTSTSISFSSFTYFLSLVYDSFNNRLLLSFNDSTAVKCFVVNATASSLTVGSAQIVSNTDFSQAQPTAVDCSTDGRILFSYSNTSSNTTVGKAASLSNLTLTFGSETTLFPNTSDGRYVVYIPSVDRFLCTANNSWKLVAVSGTTITAGSNITGAVTTPDQQSTFYVVKPFVYNPATQGLVLYTSSNAIVGTFTTSAFTAVATLSVDSTQPDNRQQIAFDSTETKVAVIGTNYLGGSKSTVITFPSSTNLTATNYLGLSAGTYTNGQTATIQIDGSVNTAQSGLTIGSSYYVQTDGTLSVTPASPKVFAGFATTATNIAIENPTFGALSPITSTGDLIIGDGINSATRLPIGANGTALISNGTTASWATPSAGAMVYLSTVTASNASTADIENGFSSTYDNYVILADNINPSNSGTYLYAQTKIGGSYLTSSYKYNLYYMDTANASGYWEVASGGITNGVKLAYYMSNNDSGPTSFFNFKMDLQGINANVRQAISTHLYGYSSADRGRSNFSVGLSEQSNGLLRGIRILISSGTFSGTFKLYGIAKS